MENTRSTKAEEGWIKATSLATLYQEGIPPLLSFLMCCLVVLWSSVCCALCALCGAMSLLV